MGRPPRRRIVECLPKAAFFKPAGIPARELQQVELAVDEVEALRLTDLLGLSQEEAADRLGVSRPTVGRVLEAARRKVADALVNGKALAIEGGVYQILRSNCCEECGHRWVPMTAAEGPAPGPTAEGPAPKDERCPFCGSAAVRRCPPPMCGRGVLGAGRPGGGPGVGDGFRGGGPGAGRGRASGGGPDVRGGGRGAAGPAASRGRGRGRGPGHRGSGG